MKVVAFFRDVYLGIKGGVNKRLFHTNYTHYMVFLFGLPFVLDFVGNFYYYYNFCFGPRTHVTMDPIGYGFRPQVQGWYSEDGFSGLLGEIIRIRKGILAEVEFGARIGHPKNDLYMPTFAIECRTAKPLPPTYLGEPRKYWIANYTTEHVGYRGREYWQVNYKTEDLNSYLQKVARKLNHEKFVFNTNLVTVQEHPYFDHRYVLFSEDVYLERDPRSFLCKLERAEQRQLGQDGGAEHDIVRNLYLEDVDIDFLFDWGLYFATFAVFTYEVVFGLLASGSFFIDMNAQMHDDVE